MSEIKIEKGVPMPEKKSAHSKYPFGEMEVGDSFFVNKPHGKFAGSITYARAVYQDRKFKAATEGEGTRVWRVS